MTLTDITTDGKKLVVIGCTFFSTSSILTSEDGIKWTERLDSSQKNTELNHVLWNGRFFIATGWNGKIYTSSNGLKWSVTQSKIVKGIQGLVWTGKYFVGQYFNYIYKSIDGIHWSILSDSNQDCSNDIAWGNNLFVIVGMAKTICNSPDGIEWSVVEKGSVTYIRNLLYDGEKYLAVGGDASYGGGILSSADGITWNTVFEDRDHFIADSVNFHSEVPPLYLVLQL